MRQILVYGDSLSWGIVPDTRERFPFEVRWPGALEMKLGSLGLQVRILEDSLNGRRTVWEDSFKAGRNGLVGLSQRMEIHSPLSLVILMLGTNDFQFSHPHNNAWSAAQGITTLVNEIRRAPIEPGMPVPPILIVAPPPIGVPQGALAPKFSGAEVRCRGLADAYRAAADVLNCYFFDAGSVTASSEVDGIHLDREQHLALGQALAAPVIAILDAIVG
jgi:lysophospholipase L1-like esterase